MSAISSVAIRIKKCNSSLNSTRPCANDTVLNSFLNRELGTFTASLYAVNPIINPGSIDYLDWEVDDSLFLTFSLQQGGMLIQNIEDYTIETDESLFPWSSDKTERGIVFPELPKYNTFQANSTLALVRLSAYQVK